MGVREASAGIKAKPELAFSRRGPLQLGKGCQRRGDEGGQLGRCEGQVGKRHEDRERAKPYFRSVYINEWYFL